MQHYESSELSVLFMSQRDLQLPTVQNQTEIDLIRLAME